MAELNTLNLNLPARVWLPLHSTIPHHIVRVPPQYAAVLNSKDKVRERGTFSFSYNIRCHLCAIGRKIQYPRSSICITYPGLQAPYIMYVEVLEVEDLYTSPVPTKIMGSSLRHTKSEENLTGGEQSDISTPDSQQNSAVRQTPVKNVSPYSVRNADVAFSFPDDDPNDCWSQEDDEITQQVGGDSNGQSRSSSLSSISILFLPFSSICSSANRRIATRSRS